MSRPPGLRRQILLSVTGLVVLGFAIVTVASAVGLYSFLQHRVDTQLRAISGVIMTRGVDLPSLAAGAADRPPGPAPVLHVVELRRPDGSIVDVARPADHPPLTPPLSSRVDDLAERAGDGSPFWVPGDAEFRAVALRAPDGATLLVAAPMAPVRQVVMQLLLFEALLCVGLVGVVGVLGHLALSRGLRPLECVTATADAIAAGDHSRRVPDVGSGDEVGRLGRATNAMVTQLVSALDGHSHSEGRLLRFVADASHELRTPLTSIRGYVQLLRSGAIADADVGDALWRVEQESRRMSELIEQMLMLARRDEGRSLDRVVVDLAAIVRDNVADAAVLEPDRPISVHGPARCEVVADATGLNQVVANLLANVRAHTPRGTPASVEIVDEGGGVTLRVSDEGPGMEPAATAHAFDRFYRADRSRSRFAGTGGGYGLGLSIVHDVVADHGGSVRLDSTLGAGTTVAIVLPVATEQA